MERVIDVMFIVGGGALVAHVLLCILLQFRLRGHEELARRLLAIPNRKLAERAGVRLLRARYYLPWVRAVADGSDVDAGTRSVISAARITGLIVPVAFLGFLVASVLQSAM